MSDGTKFALGAVGLLAAAGAVASRSRGSRALSSMTAVAGLDPSQPWKAMVGAAKNAPSQEKWKAKFRNYPFDVDLHVVGNRRDEETWLRDVRRPAPGKLKIVVQARTFSSDPQMARAIEAKRKQAPSDAFALMTPFTTLHRIFDSSYERILNAALDAKVKRPALALTDELGSVVLDGLWSPDGWPVLLSDFIEKHDSSSRREQDERDAEVEAKWNYATTVYDASRDLLLGNSNGEGQMFLLYEPDEMVEAFEPYLEKGEDCAQLFARVVASLTCPTAAGRLLRLQDYSQAMADCYATWAIANRNPLVRLTEDDLFDFRVDKQIDRWLKSIGGQQNTTDVAIKRYRESLERVAVPVLRWVAENDDEENDGYEHAIVRATAAGRILHNQREPLIDACNEVLGMQRVLAI